MAGTREDARANAGAEIKPGKAEERFQLGQQAGEESVDCYVHCLNEPVAFASDANTPQSVTAADRWG